MNTLIRQNASTPAEIQNVFQQYIREEQMKKIFKNAAAFLYWAQFRIIKAERKGRKRLYGRMNCLFQRQRLFISLERQYFIAVKM